MSVPTPKPTMFCQMSANIANLVFVFWCLEVLQMTPVA
jgi:hypothetical protein